MSKRAKTVSVVESEGVSSAFDSKKPFRFMGCMKEDHKQPIYAVSFCDHGEPHKFIDRSGVSNPSYTTRAQYYGRVHHRFFPGAWDEM